MFLIFSQIHERSLLDHSWALFLSVLGAFWATLGRSRIAFGRSWALFGRSLRALGRSLDPVWALLRLCLGALGTFLAPCWQTLGTPGRISGSPGFPRAAPKQMFDLFSLEFRFETVLFSCFLTFLGLVPWFLVSGSLLPWAWFLASWSSGLVPWFPIVGFSDFLGSPGSPCSPGYLSPWPLGFWGVAFPESLDH